MQFNRRQLAITAAAFPLVNSVSAFAQSATPASPVSGDVELAAASSRITSLGQYAPARKFDVDFDFNWMDPERQIFRIARETEDDERIQVFIQSAFGTGPAYLTYIVLLEELMGFGLPNVLQASSANLPPENIQMFRLDIDVTELPALWAESGYEERENDFGTYWTIGEDGEFEVGHPIQGVAFASVNNIALLDDRTIAFAPTANLISQVMGTGDGDTPNILEGLDPVTDALPETAISAWYAHGARLEFSSVAFGMAEDQTSQIEEIMTQSDDAAGEMPVVRSLCVGATEGASRDPERSLPDSDAFAILEVESDVEAAVNVITWRHENMFSMLTGQPYTELMGEIEIEVVGDSTLRVSSQTGAALPIFNQMLVRADTLLFCYRQ